MALQQPGRTTFVGLTPLSGADDDDCEEKC
jgi:hypothetical protein